MKVYVLDHNTREYDMGDQYIRGIYATEAAAKAALTQLEVHEYGTTKHDESCCEVTGWDVKGESGSEIGSETPENPSPTHESHNTAGIGTGADERA